MQLRYTARAAAQIDAALAYVATRLATSGEIVILRFRHAARRPLG
jgi:hypothetical protein